MKTNNKSNRSPWRGKLFVITPFLLVLIISGGLLISNIKDNPLPEGTGNTVEKNNAALQMTGIIEARIGQQDVTITWKTNLDALGQIEYGTTTSYGSLSDITRNTGTAHEVTFGNLKPGTLYHYRVKSTAENVSSVSEDRTFTTPAPSEDMIYGISIGFMDVIFKIDGRKVIIQPDAENVLTQVKKDGFIVLRMQEPFSSGYMHHFPELPVQAVKLLVDRGFKVLLCINGSPFLSGSTDPKRKWVYRFYPGGDKEGKDDDGGLPEHKKRLTRFMDALNEADLIKHMQFQIFDEPNAKSYFWGTYDEFEKLLAANVEVLTNQKYGIANKDILCCSFTSSLVLNRKAEDDADQIPYFNFIKAYKSNPLVNKFPFSFHWYPSNGISNKAFNYTTADIKINPMYEGSYITEMHISAFMTKDHLMGKSGMKGYRERDVWKEKVEEIIAYMKANRLAGIYFFNLKNRTDEPNEKGRVATGLFNAKGCPRHEYKQLLEILKRPANFGPCGDPTPEQF